MNPKYRGPKCHIWQDASGDFRWAVLAANGKSVAVSGEGIRSQAYAKRAVLAAVRTIVKALDNDAFVPGRPKPVRNSGPKRKAKK